MNDRKLHIRMIVGLLFFIVIFIAISYKSQTKILNSADLALVEKIDFQKIESLPSKALSLNGFAVSEDEMSGGAEFSGGNFFRRDDYSYIAYKTNSEMFYYKIYNPGERYIDVAMDGNALAILHRNFSCVIVIENENVVIEDYKESSYDEEFFDSSNKFERTMKNGTTYKLQKRIIFDKLISISGGKTYTHYCKITSSWVFVLLLTLLFAFPIVRYVLGRKRKIKN